MPRSRKRKRRQPTAIPLIGSWDPIHNVPASAPTIGNWDPIPIVPAAAPTIVVEPESPAPVITATTPLTTSRSTSPVTATPLRTSRPTSPVTATPLRTSRPTSPVTATPLRTSRPTCPVTATPLRTSRPTSPVTATPLRTSRPTCPATATPLRSSRPTSPASDTPLRTSRSTSPVTATPLRTSRPTSPASATPLRTSRSTSPVTATPLRTSRPTSPVTATPLRTSRPTSPVTATPLRTSRPTCPVTATPLRTSRSTSPVTPTPLRTSRPTSPVTATPLRTSRSTSPATATSLRGSQPTPPPITITKMPRSRGRKKKRPAKASLSGDWDPIPIVPAPTIVQEPGSATPPIAPTTPLRTSRSTFPATTTATPLRDSRSTPPKITITPLLSSRLTPPKITITPLRSPRPTPPKITITPLLSSRPKHPAGQTMLKTTPIPDWSTVIKETDEPAPTTLRATKRVADWDEFLREPMNINLIPPVSSFKYAPLTDEWADVALSKIGYVVEVPNPFIRCPKPIYWYGRIICFAGYKAFVQFENLGASCKYGTWMSFCSEIPKPLGYCNRNRILLYPPSGIQAEKPNFLELAKEKLKNVQTISEDHHSSTVKILKKYQKYMLDTVVEVMDRDAPHRMRMARVTGIVGDRIHVMFLTALKDRDPGYWFSVNSEHVHPVGFSYTVGFQLYHPIQHDDYEPLPEHCFPKYPPELVLKEGQVLEARHPYHPEQICACSVAKVYKFGYFLAEFHTKYDKAPTHFGFHVTSPYVLPIFWSQDRQIALVPPHGEGAGDFDWNVYCRTHKLEPSPLNLIPERKHHNFFPGYKLEAFCCINPTYLGPATIRKVADHLLYISFDGWTRNPFSPHKSDLWIDAESCDIYPPGYAELVGHEFQGKVDPPLVKFGKLAKPGASSRMKKAAARK